MIAKVVLGILTYSIFIFSSVNSDKNSFTLGKDVEWEIPDAEMVTRSNEKQNFLDFVTLRPSGMRDVWIGRLVLNCISYSSIILPCFLLVTFVKRKKLLEGKNNNCVIQYLRLFVEGNRALSFESMKVHKSTSIPSVQPPAPASFIRQTLLLLFYVFGLLISYLTWGVLQERVMVYEYKEPGEMKGERFKNSQFIVFANRVLAFLVAIVSMIIVRQPTHKAPVYKYLYSSFSNIMSSWCQYEALKFVSFPVQVLAKTSKVIPVMLMGRFVSRRSYSLFEYLTALLISIGVFIFLITSKDGLSSKRAFDTTTTVSGFVIMVGYLAFDAFTSNWQDNLFQSYHMKPLQMMAGVNFFSVLLTFVSLTEQGTLMDSLLFAWRHPTFFLHVSILSLTSAVGQVFIFATISMFGPATFTIVMTVRQGLAILLSCIIYGHQVSTLGGLGVAMIFFSLFIRIYHKQTKAKKAKKAAGDAGKQNPLNPGHGHDFKVNISK